MMVGTFKYYSMAAEVDNALAHYHLSYLTKDKSKGFSHLEAAAIEGHSDARYNLGCYEGQSGWFDRGVKR